MEIIENALVDISAGSSSEDVDRAADDSDAVLSVFYPEQRTIGGLLSNSNGRPSVLHQVLQFGTLVVGVRFALLNAENNTNFAGLDETTDLLRVAGYLGGISFASLSLSLESTRVALMPGGLLEQLSVGKQKISTAAARRLARWRVFLGTVASLSLVIGIGTSVAITIRYLTHLTGEYSLATFIQKLPIPFLWLGPIPIIASGWWSSMFTASCLTR